MTQRKGGTTAKEAEEEGHARILLQYMSQPSVKTGSRNVQRSSASLTHTEEPAAGAEEPTHNGSRGADPQREQKEHWGQTEESQ